ncbi:MAG: TldD/PmbA family protein [bacterium]|nr:TldD/PmbA family protein [bacterium]
MTNKERTDLARWAVKEALSAGAQDAAVDIANWRTIEVEYRDGSLDNLKESVQNSLDVAVYVDNRYSSHTTNDLRRDGLKKFVAEAVALTKYLGEDPHRGLPDPIYYEDRETKDLRIVDDAYDSITSDQRVKTALEIEARARKLSDEIISCTGWYEDTLAESVRVTSNGFEGTRRSTSFGSGLQVTVKDESGGRPRDWRWGQVRLHQDLLRADDMAKGAVAGALAKRGQAKISSGSYDMVVENRAASKLIGSLTGPMSARSIQQKSSFLEGKTGQKIASEKLTIIDDPFIEFGLGSRLYDGEGMSTRKRVMVDKGVLQAYYINCYYGRKLNMTPNSGGKTNTVYTYGTHSLDELVGMMKKGILVTGFIGGNSNATTGDYSFGIVGMYVEDGKIIKPVNEMNISGNLGELFGRLTEVGNDPYAWSSNRRPSLYFKDIDFAGL